MQGFSQRVQGLLQLLKEGEREELIAKLDPAMAQKLKERRAKEQGMPGKGGLNPELDKKISYRGNGVPEPQELGKAMLESAGRYHLQNNPPEVKFSEEDSEDFTTCQRPDGSKYGTSGQCRKGKETTREVKENKGKKSGGGSGTELAKKVEKGEKFISRARAAMKKLQSERGMAQMRLQMGKVEELDKALKRLRKKAEQIGGELDELTGTKGQGKYYIP